MSEFSSETTLGRKRRRMSNDLNDPKQPDRMALEETAKQVAAGIEELYLTSFNHSECPQGRAAFDELRVLTVWMKSNGILDKLNWLAAHTPDFPERETRGN